ncbi:MAG: sugar ABC transporter substrate-binding protein [Armatimonadota bacterium]|nr:sugar ABC transporter substrate-binding protein [Armatimonadota bacterium]
MRGNLRIPSAVFAAAALLVVALAVPARPAPGPTLSFWMKKTFVEPSNDAVALRVKEFERANQVTVDLRLIPYEDFRPQWSAAIESGNVPDVSFFGYQEVGQFYKQGVLLDLSDVVKQVQASNAKMTDSLVSAITFEGKQWAVPFWSESTILFYRKDLFQKAGLTRAPNTWDEFIQYAKKLTDPAAGVYGAGFGLGRGNSDSEWWMRDILWSHGAALFTADGKGANINTPEGKVAFNWLRDFFTMGITPPGAIGWDDAGNNRAYLSGQAAMIINVGSVYYVLSTSRQDLMERTGFALVPRGPKGRFIVGLSNNLGIFKRSRNPELAKRLVAYMLDQNWQRVWMRASGYQVVSPYPRLSEDDFWRSEAGRTFTLTPLYYRFLGYPGPFTPAAGEVANSRLLTDAVERMVVQKQPTDDVLKWLQAEITKVISKFGK